MTPHGKVAVEFASALVEGDFARAHALLAPRLRQELTPQDLRDRLYSMFREYATGEPTRILFDDEYSAEDWPAKQPGDLGWAYVGILGEDFAEAVTVTVADVEGERCIRHIEWGRP
jgi:hypothetical protein